MTAAERKERGDVADAACAAAFARVVREPSTARMALVAVGGYGRLELAPHSDLDLVLVHEDEVDVTPVASEIWYPLWDFGTVIDHSVRSLSEVTTAAGKDLRVALGLLDARHVAGDPALTLRLRTSVLARWRRDARRRLPDLHEMVSDRGARVGELAHASVPDLKESIGGLRDATALKSLVASWLVDVPHTDLERCRRNLLDVRDCLHGVSGRSTDRVAPELWDDLARGLGLDGAEQAQRLVRETGRRITHISRLTWSRVDAVLARSPPRRAGPEPRGGSHAHGPSAGGRRHGPMLEPVATGIAVYAGEVVLDRRADPGSDPLLLLRAAVEAAERNLILAPATAARTARECSSVPEPWDEETRSLFTRLLAAGSGLRGVWETLDETGGLDRILPVWERVRFLPHASIVHRFTVDRHLVETCIEAARLVRRVARPDVLMIAALLHDIGKGDLRDHSVVGADVAAEAAQTMGLDAQEVDLVRSLVRWHLLLVEVATTRDPEDPETLRVVAERVGDTETLDLLEVLTEADARATAPKAWTPWRAQLVGQLVTGVRSALCTRGAALSGPPTDIAEEPEAEVPSGVREDSASVDVQVVASGDDGSRVQVCSGDRVGLLAATAAALGAQRATIRSARAWTQGEFAFSSWEVSGQGLDATLLRQHLVTQLEGDPLPLLPKRPRDAPEAVVVVRPEASRRATVLEVRAEDRPGVVLLVCSALAVLDLSVRSAHVSTFGPQAVDVFYVQEVGAGSLSDERAAGAAHAVRRALAGWLAGQPRSARLDRLNRR